MSDKRANRIRGRAHLHAIALPTTVVGPRRDIVDHMSRKWSTTIGSMLTVAAVLAAPAVSFAQIRVITSDGFSNAYHEVLPEFERTTGIKVTTGSGSSQGKGPDTVGAQLRRGVPADVVILSREGLTELIADGRIAAGTDVDLAQTPLGMGVRAGAPKPDITTVDDFRRALLQAKIIAIPASTGSVAMVANGEAVLSIQPVSEILHVPGVDLAGTIPKEIQYISVFSAAVVAGSKELQASKKLIAFLASERARTAIQKSGMESAKSSSVR